MGIGGALMWPAVGLGLDTALVTSQSSLADGISLAFEVDAVLAFAGLVVVLVFIGRTEPARATPARCAGATAPTPDHDSEKFCQAGVDPDGARSSWYRKHRRTAEEAPCATHC